MSTPTARLGTDRITEIRQRNAALDRAPHIRDDIAVLLAEVEQLTIERDQARADRQAAWDGLRETDPKVDRVAALAADLQRRGDTEGARLIFAALNGERA